jgi:hypothetical protein
VVSSEFVEVDAGSPQAQAAMTAYFACSGSTTRPRRSSALLRFLEQTSVDSGRPTIRLDTNPVLLEAIAMYRRSGYADIERYNDNPYAGLWFEKRL